MVKKHSSKQNRVYIKIVIFFLFLTLVAIFVIVHFALTKVTIKVYSNLENKTASVLVEIQPESTEQISSEAILGKILTTEFKLETSVPGNEEVTQSDKAGGYVTIYNNYSKSQILVKTTRLLTTDNKLYRLADRVDIPAGGQVTVWAEADQAGEQYVIEPTKFTIPGLWIGLQDKIYAENLDGMKLQAVPKQTVTTKNLEEAQEKITAEAKIKSLATFNENLSKNLKIGPDRLSLQFETIDTSLAGQVSPETYLKQNITAYGLVFTEEDLYDLAQKKFARELDSSQALVEFKPENFSYSILEINPEKDKAVLEVKIEAVVSANSNLLNIDKEKLIGLDYQGIQNYFQELKIEKADVKFFPFWVKKVPKLKDHIIIE